MRPRSCHPAATATVWGVLPVRQSTSLRLRTGPVLERRARGRLAGAVRLELLGGFELLVERQTAALPLHVQRLLVFLALNNRAMHRAYVAGSLWLEASQEHANACLRTTLWRARGLPCSLVEATTTHLRLAPSVAVDAHELARSAERVLHGPAAADNDIERLASPGDLLPDWYDDWVLQERERLRHLRLLALEAACDELIGEGRYADAVEAALAAVGADPLRESAHRLLISSHLSAGNVVEALRQYAAFCARLRHDLGLEPSPQIVELVRSCDPGVADKDLLARSHAG